MNGDREFRRACVRIIIAARTWAHTPPLPDVEVWETAQRDLHDAVTNLENINTPRPHAEQAAGSEGQTQGDYPT